MSEETSTVQEGQERLCPLCSHEGYERPEEIPQDIVDKFLMSTLGKQPFEHTYSFLQDHIQVTAKALDPAEEDLVASATLMLMNAYSVFPGIPQDIGPAVTNSLRTCCAVREITVIAGGTRTSFTRPEGYFHELQECIDDMSKELAEACGDVNEELAVAAMRRANKQFVEHASIGSSVPMSLLLTATMSMSELQTKLVRSCYDESFWKGTGTW